MNARAYDPQIGRVMSADLVVADATSSQAWNAYSYVGNSPLVFRDPTGWQQQVPVELPSVIVEPADRGAGGGDPERRRGGLQSGDRARAGGRKRRPPVEVWLREQCRRAGPGVRI